MLRPTRLALALGLSALALAPRAHAQVSAAAYPARRASALARAGDDLVIVPARASFPADDQMGFVQAADFQYLTGLDDQLGAVLVLDGHARSATLFVARAIPMVSRTVLAPDAATAARLTLGAVLPVDSLEPWLRRRFASAATTVHVAPVDARVPVTTPLPMASSLTRWTSWLTTLGATRVQGAVPLLRPLREIKDGAEIAILREVARTSGQAFLAGIRGVRPGRRQQDAELDVVLACRAAGARSVSFWPWTMSGPNADYHNLWYTFQAYDHADRAMQAGEVVRVDVGCQVDHYMGDVGRTAPVSGRFTDGQREAWDLFIAGYKAGLTVIKDGVSAQTVYAAALAEVRRLAPTMKTAQGKEAAAVLLGPTGIEAWELHGVGLDDAEGMPETLRAGMVVAYELMFVAGGDGFYLEDLVHVRADGREVLTAGLPYTAAEIEAAMKGPNARRAGTRAPAR
jgi:Xaa-Pro aminopeptidase